MDDIQILVYIVFLAIAFLSRIIGKRRKQAENDREPQQEESSEPQMTFEDLLKEFTDGKRKKREEPIPEKPEEIEDIEPEPYNPHSYELKDDDEISKVFENSVKAAETEEATGLGEEGKKIRFKEFAIDEEEENEFAQEIKEMISNPDTAKKAVILSEIINRRY